MSEQWRDMINQVIVKEGVPGKIRLAAVAGRGQRMIELYAKGESVPPSEIAYRLALACGASEKRAETLAGFVPTAAKETA